MRYPLGTLLMVAEPKSAPVEEQRGPRQPGPKKRLKMGITVRYIRRFWP